MIFIYVYYRNGKMHYNTLAGFQKHNKWAVTDVMHNKYVLDTNEYEFIHDLNENYFAVVGSAEKFTIDHCKSIMQLGLDSLKYDLECNIGKIKNVTTSLGGN